LNPWKLTKVEMRCLNELIDAQLSGRPAEFRAWRARNSKRIPIAEKLQRLRLIESQNHYRATFVGLTKATSPLALEAQSTCKSLFRAFRRRYPSRSNELISIVELARALKSQSEHVGLCCEFLSSSPAGLGISSEGDDRKYSMTERYVTFRSFEALVEEATSQAMHAIRALHSSLVLSAEPANAGHVTLENCESEEVRGAWRKAIDRVARDPEGAITAARTLLEAACKYVLVTTGHRVSKRDDLQDLFKRTFVELGLKAGVDARADVRKVLSGSSAIVQGLAEMRNDLGDAHGRGAPAHRPARRHAELAVALASGVSRFLVETLDANTDPLRSK